MRTGSLLDVAEVLKGPSTAAQGKPLSFREKKMLERRSLSPGERAGDVEELGRSEIEEPAEQSFVEMQTPFPGSLSMET